MAGITPAAGEGRVHHRHQEPVRGVHEPSQRKRRAVLRVVERVLQVVAVVCGAAARKDDEDEAAEADGHGNHVVEHGARGGQGLEAGGVVGGGHHLPAVVEDGDGDLLQCQHAYCVCFAHRASV